MAEPLSDLPNDAASLQSAASQDADAALEKSADLPFFDLDIQLIRREPKQTSALQGKAELAKAVPPQSAQAAAPLPSREQQALAALEALVKTTTALVPVTQLPVALPVQTTATPVAETAPIPAAKYVMPSIMPVPAPSQGRVDFVQPGFERVAPVAPIIQTVPMAEPDRLSQITAALLRSAFEVTSRAPDLRAALQTGLQTAAQFQKLADAIAMREAKLYNTTQTAVSESAAAAQPTAAVADEQPDDLTNDLPWGHVTYRLFVM